MLVSHEQCVSTFTSSCLLLLLLIVLLVYSSPGTCFPLALASCCSPQSCPQTRKLQSVPKYLALLDQLPAILTLWVLLHQTPLAAKLSACLNFPWSLWPIVTASCCSNLPSAALLCPVAQPHHPQVHLLPSRPQLCETSGPESAPFPLNVIKSITMPSLSEDQGSLSLSCWTDNVN